MVPSFGTTRFQHNLILAQNREQLKNSAKRGLRFHYPGKIAFNHIFHLEDVCSILQETTIEYGIMGVWSVLPKDEARRGRQLIHSGPSLPRAETSQAQVGGIEY